MTDPQVNGDHLLAYPLVNDSIHAVKSNEYAQRSIKLGDSPYQTVAGPVLCWIAKPYEYVKPDVARADSLGDKTLDRIDERFPIIKKPTSDLYNETRSLILFPYNKSVAGRDHIFEVYAIEVKKVEQQGLVGQGKAAVSTAFVVSNETLGWLSSFLAAKKADATSAAKEKTNQ